MEDMFFLISRSLMYGFVRLVSSSMLFTDCLFFGAIISATDPGISYF